MILLVLVILIIHVTHHAHRLLHRRRHPLVVLLWRIVLTIRLLLHTWIILLLLKAHVRLASKLRRIKRASPYVEGATACGRRIIAGNEVIHLSVWGESRSVHVDVAPLRDKNFGH